MHLKFITILLVGYVAGCSSRIDDDSVATDNNQNAMSAEVKEENLPIPSQALVSEYNVLFMGNSHIKGLANPLRMLFATGAPQKSIGILAESRGGFLADRLEDDQSIEILKNTAWSHVIFQAQKYSQSGRRYYPTVAAQTWINMAKSQNTMPILFPEHPQRGNRKEAQKVHDLHVSIANIQSSCVAPVGLVWDRVSKLKPTIKLHQADGNHASAIGRFLTALVFYETISGLPADLVPYLNNINIDMSTQKFLGQITSEVLAENPPCRY